MEAAAPPVPARGTRPRNRRALILGAASELFARHGYAHTSMTDIAAAVGIGPSALYRHFAGKQQLLAEVIDAGLAPLQHLTADMGVAPDPETLAQLAAYALDNRLLSTLWQREVRHLPDDERRRFSRGLREVTAELATRIGRARPELDADTTALAARTVLAVLASPALHDFAVDDRQYAALLAELLSVVLRFPFPPAPAAAARPSSASAPEPPAQVAVPAPASRREELLVHAIRLFARDGYAAVGLDEIGAAAGISGPSVYKHFPNKLALLTTALQRGAGTLFTGVSAAYARHATADAALRSLLRSYLDFAADHPDLVGLLVTELEHLPESEYVQLAHTQRDYLREWAHLLQALDPESPAVAARVRVATTIDVINAVARSPRPAAGPALTDRLTPLCLGMLGLEPAAPR